MYVYIQAISVYGDRIIYVYTYVKMFCFLERSFNFCLEMKTVFVSDSIVQL